MLRVGLVGIGFMGWIHYLAYQKTKGVKLAAVCTRDREAAGGDWRGIQGNFGPPGEQVDLSAWPSTRDLDDAAWPIRRSTWSISACRRICTPRRRSRRSRPASTCSSRSRWALTAAECDKMVRRPRRPSKQILVGHVLPFLPEYAFACKAIDSGKYGKLLGGHFKRVISDPLVAQGLLRSRQSRRAAGRSARSRRPFHPAAVRHADGRDQPGPAARRRGRILRQPVPVRRSVARRHRRPAASSTSRAARSPTASRSTWKRPRSISTSPCWPAASCKSRR